MSSGTRNTLHKVQVGDGIDQVKELICQQEVRVKDRVVRELIKDIVTKCV